MQKDYIEVKNSASNEIDFVEDYWTGVWDNLGGVQQIQGNPVADTEEFRALERRLKDLPRGAVIMDGGCGRGEWVAGLASLGLTPIGVDISKKTVASLRKHLPGIRFETGDIRNLEMPADSLDAYISLGVFEHFEEGLQGCIREAFRLIKPRGWLYITVPFLNRRHLSRAWKYFRRNDSSPDASRKQRFYQWRLTRDELHFELQQGGFEIVEMRPVAHTEGVSRLIHHATGLAYQGRALRLATRIGKRIIPATYAAHMLLAVARKPG